MTKKTYNVTDALADAATKVRRATEERDNLIRSVAGAGEQSQRAIARATGMSHTAIQVILRREPEPA